MASAMGASLLGASSAGLQSACRQRAGLSQLSTRQGGEQGRRAKLSAVRCSALPPDVAASAMADRLASGDLTAPSMDVSAAASMASSALDAINTWSLAVGVGLPCTVMDCGDHVHRSTLPVDDSLRLTVGGILLVSTVVGYLWSTPGVAPGFFDMFVLAPLERRLRRKMKKDDLVLGRKMGEGGYGSVYKAQLAGKPDSQLVVKRANDFGAVEIWMNERVRRACPEACASFISGFVERTRYSEEFWLVFEFEGDSTFAKVLEQKDFPYNVESAVLGRVPREPKGPAREMRVIRRLMRNILESLQKLHSIGIVHRDIKPQNMIFNSRTGSLKIIDLGAAADLRVGINYNPNEFLLDPRYAAPEQYIMSTQTPKAPPPAVATALSPVLWQMNLPDRFDMYSAGLIFLQMVFPSLRSDSGLIAFNRQLKRCDNDLVKWREQAERRATPELMHGFELLDLNGGLGWQLVQAMMRTKGRKRISASVALLHPFFDPGAPTLLQRVRLGLLRLVNRDNSELSTSFVQFMARSEPQNDAGGFTEMSLQKFRREERKKQDSFDRNAAAYAWRMQRKMAKRISTTFGGQEDESKKNAWWNRWARSSVDNA